MYEAKRSLGQNFFSNISLANKIVDFTVSSSPKTILEIGPGTGSFTNIFTERGFEVIAIEKDDDLASYIGSLNPNMKVYNDDILQFDFSNLVLEKQNTVCYGSLPYNISKKIIRLLLKVQPVNDYYFIIQREVAEKYSPKTKKSNLLSLTSSLYAESKILLNINPEAFRPRPKVNSSLIHFKIKDNILLDEENEKIEKLIKTAFGKPRKTLSNNIPRNMDIELGEYEKARAEDLVIEDFIKILSYNSVNNEKAEE
jgi:16S rRNA (adenine1518-N6/adenine1519-N6)-dimethyltransferase